MRHDNVSKLAKPKDAQDEHHDHDQTDDVDNVIHGCLPIWLPSLVTGRHNRENDRAGSNNHCEITGSRLRCSALPPLSCKLTVMGSWAIAAISAAAAGSDCGAKEARPAGPARRSGFVELKRGTGG
jgi:hypothetical protein